MPHKIVITGGPSAGKTTLLNKIESFFQSGVAVVPEAASILFSSGHQRPTNFEEALLTQNKIYQLQRELEAKAAERAWMNCDQKPAVLCDRGSLDGGAYWPGALREFCQAMGTTVDREYDRYTLVIHLQTAEVGKGYTNTALRTETHAEASMLDSRIAENWGMHENYHFVPNQNTFEEKLALALKIIAPYFPLQEAEKKSFNISSDFFRKNPPLLHHAEG